MRHDQINIAFALDKHYMKQLMVVIHSILSTGNNSYHFWLLTDAPVELENYLQKNLSDASMCKFTVINMEQFFLNAPTPIQHITKATYYRLLIPEMIPDHKCIYMDLDIIVNDDIRYLYDIDIEQYDIAGVLALGYLKDSSWKKTYAEKIGIADLDSYINAGVLLMNLDQLRKANFSNIALEMSKQEYPCSDQDIINLLCYGKIKLLPLKYNFQPMRMEKRKSEIGEYYTDEEIMEAEDNPVIVHYLTSKKPWDCFDCDYGYLWWEKCKQTIWYDDFMKENKNSLFYYLITKNKPFWKAQIFTQQWYEYLRKYHRIFIYGAGKYANLLQKDLLEQNIQIAGFLVSDTGNNPVEKNGIKIQKFEKHLINKNDIVLVAMNVDSAYIIQKQLIKAGFYEFQIIYEQNFI